MVEVSLDFWVLCSVLPDFICHLKVFVERLLSKIGIEIGHLGECTYRPDVDFWCNFSSVFDKNVPFWKKNNTTQEADDDGGGGKPQQPGYPSSVSELLLRAWLILHSLCSKCNVRETWKGCLSSLDNELIELMLESQIICESFFNCTTTTLNNDAFSPKPQMKLKTH